VPIVTNAIPNEFPTEEADIDKDIDISISPLEQMKILNQSEQQAKAILMSLENRSNSNAAII
jgi:hypothetical protein